jgi:hypothetical protein
MKQTTAPAQSGKGGLFCVVPADKVGPAQYASASVLFNHVHPLVGCKHHQIFNEESQAAGCCNLCLVKHSCRKQVHQHRWGRVGGEIAHGTVHTNPLKSKVATVGAMDSRSSITAHEDGMFMDAISME